MIAPNPFFPPFNPMRNYSNQHNSNNNYKLKPQNPYSPNKHQTNNYSFNFSAPTNNLPDTFSKDNEKNEEKQDKPIFEIFGIKLYFDDLLIIALLFFLYKEECTDDSLFIILILLLLT